MAKIIASIVIIFSILEVLFHPSCFGQINQGNILYIFDASGSMYGGMGERTKSEIAKEVLKKSIVELPEEINVGLIFFGNRVKGPDCIRFPVPIERGARDEVIKTIKSLTPGGLTPLAASLYLAGGYLEHNNLNATVILITDGKEECRGNPFEAAKDLCERGIDVELHIIGLALDDDARGELEKIASISGGFFYDSKNPAELTEALAQASSAPGSSTGDVLKLTARGGSFKSSPKLHSIRIGEVLQMKFRPIQVIDEKTKAGHRITFNFDNQDLELHYFKKKWKLIYCRSGGSFKVDWPEGLKIKTDAWNVVKIRRKKFKTSVSINQQHIKSFSSREEAINFKVGVSGYEADFTELSVQLPLY